MGWSLKGSQEPLRTLFSVSRVHRFRNNDMVSALRQMLRRPFEEVGRHYANRSGITTPIPIAKNHRAGAGVPTGRRRRSSLALILGSSICLSV
jgi:hypothetical protein